MLNIFKNIFNVLPDGTHIEELKKEKRQIILLESSHKIMEQYELIKDLPRDKYRLVIL